MRGVLVGRLALLLPPLLAGVLAQAAAATLDAGWVRLAFQAVAVLSVMTSAGAVATAFAREPEMPAHKQSPAAPRATGPQEPPSVPAIRRESLLPSSNPPPTIRRSARVDSLTDRRLPTIDRNSGLLAQWYFILRVEEEIRRAKRYGQMFTVVTIETPGERDHRAAVDFVTRTLRQTDLAGEMGTQVALLLVQTVGVGADIVIERIRAALPSAALHVTSYPNEGVTASELLGDGSWWRSELELGTSSFAA